MPLIVCKIGDGEDVMETVKEFCEKNSVAYGDFVSASGKIADFEISAFSGSGSIENKTSSTPHDVVAISGKIQMARGAYQINLKMALARSGLNAIQGMLLKGNASGNLEIGIRNVDLKKIIEA